MNFYSRPRNRKRVSLDSSNGLQGFAPLINVMKKQGQRSQLRILPLQYATLNVGLSSGRVLR